MYRVSYIILTFFIFGDLFAQESYHQENIGWKAKNIELHALHDSANGLHAFLLANDDSIRVYLLNSLDGVEHIFSFDRSAGERILGGFIDHRKIYLFSEYKQPGTFLNYVLDAADGSVTQNFIGEDLKKETEICHFSSGNRFIYFTINRKTTEFTIYAWHSEMRVDTIRFPCSNKNTWQDIFAPQGNYFNQGKIMPVAGTGVLDIDAVGNLNKTYFIHDTLFMILNKNIGFTKVYAFDLMRDRLSYREIKNDSVKKKYLELNTGHGSKFIVDEDYVDNTLLKDGKLYFISAKPDRLFISISDFYSGTLLQKFLTLKEDSIAYRNTPVIQEGTEYMPNERKELVKTKQLLKKMLKANAFIGVVDGNAGVDLTVGAYEPFKSGGGSGQMTGNGFSGVPGSMQSVPYRNDYRSPWFGSVHFSMRLDSPSLNHIPGSMPASIHDRINELNNNSKLSDGVEYLFERNNYYIYIYYDKKLRSLVFTRFQ